MLRCRLVLCLVLAAGVAAASPPEEAQSDDVIATKGSIASGRDTLIEGDVYLGPTHAEIEAGLQRVLSTSDLQDLVREAARGPVLETDSRVRELGAALDLRDQALAGMFEILERQAVPPERLSGVLAEIAARHKSLLERVRLLDASDPRIAELRDAAAEAVEVAEYERADTLLAEAEAVELEAMRQLRETLDRKRCCQGTWAA